MTKSVNKAGLAVDAGLYQFISEEAMSGLRIDVERHFNEHGLIEA